MSISFLSPVIAATVAMLGVYYLFRILVISDAGQLNAPGRRKSSIDELNSTKRETT